MLVVDNQLAYPPGETRALTQEQLDKFGEEDPQADSTQPVGNSEGVLALVETPGQDAVVKVLLKRIWGVE
jgi:hypothetical protein